jgi:hypothetical protein
MEKKAWLDDAGAGVPFHGRVDEEPQYKRLRRLLERTTHKNVDLVNWGKSLLEYIFRNIGR